jgi:hypothetical protein
MERTRNLRMYRIHEVPLFPVLDESVAAIVRTRVESPSIYHALRVPVIHEMLAMFGAYPQLYRT